MSTKSQYQVVNLVARVKTVTGKMKGTTSRGVLPNTDATVVTTRSETGVVDPRDAGDHREGVGSWCDNEVRREEVGKERDEKGEIRENIYVSLKFTILKAYN